MAARRARAVELYHDKMAELCRLSYIEVRTNTNVLENRAILKAQFRNDINGRQKIKAFEK